MLERLSEIERYGGDLDRHFPAALLEVEEFDAELRGATAAKPIRATCSTEYRALRSSGTRRIAEITLLVLHTTESLTARGAARWFTNPACQGSAHVVVDGLECFRTLPPSVIPWAAPGTNGRGWHLEIAGRAEWNRAEWLRHPSTLERAAFKLAWHARAFKVPLTWLTPAELKNGKRGVVDHNQASKVYGGTHWDVGTGFPIGDVLRRARVYRKDLEL